MGSEEHVCPACGQPVDTVVRRHKTLGAWVPTWVAGPCRNPECEAYAEEGAEHEEKHEPRHEPKREQTGTPGTPTAQNS
ncbi:hypothetical protein EJ357_31005 [Streptomyces cyaneochromogenes]|uniref:Uncharacterized protein n=1 Tax=Streptomyces cyaneochromogenes TaxID=2496836 RepID=A0A3S9MDV8_9ACTN|nr:hypothetical protein [Streptomyces cyaneochromogenes]AZQ37333.1 hypothetical protein EJ357_31005 [Streptomyces cyaneochromogenes]